MSYVSVLPATLATAATEVARIGSALSLASAVAAAQTSAVQAAAADEVSAAIAALFSAHGRDFQALSARAAAFHHEFVQALAAGAGSYAVAEIAAASPLQSLIDVFNAPIQAATGRPLIGNGANGAPGTGANGGLGGRIRASAGAQGLHELGVKRRRLCARRLVGLALGTEQRRNRCRHLIGTRGQQSRRVDGRRRISRANRRPDPRQIRCRRHHQLRRNHHP